MLAPSGLRDYRLLTAHMRLTFFAAVPLLFATLGCAGTVSGASGDAETATSTSAVVVIERSVDATEGAHAESSARFVRVTAPASVDDALQTIGASLELPVRGTCASLTSLAGRTRRSETTPVVELVDVGAVWLEADGVETHLSPRQVPDITDVVSGVVYARATEAALLPSATRYVVHVAGGQDLAPLNVSALAPDDPSAVGISGEDGHGSVVASSPTVDLAWTPDGSDDVLYVDVRPQGVRCAFGNVGHAAISTLFFDDTGTLVIHRLRREPLRAPGIDAGEVRFDFARAVAYTRH
jgi:hypothetical protein